jgi:Na+/melibiose symporter-like transporter
MAVSKQSILAYCASGVAFHMIASAFNFYYVKVYINYYHIEENWFQVAQILHLVWNAASNPLFAYIQDSTNLRITKTRRESILYCGPIFALSFIVPWIPWGDAGSWIVGVHLIIALFIWDTMFTFIGLALSALFTELAQNTEERITLIRYAQMASVIGAPSVLVLEFTSDSLQNFRAFQVTTIIIALCSLLLFIYTGNNAHTKYDLMKEKKDDSDTGKNKTLSESYWKQVGQILVDRNFVSFIVTNFCHGFHKTFLNSFIAILCDQLVSDEDVPKSIRKTFYGGISLMSTVSYLTIFE